MIWRLLNLQGLVGLAASASLAVGLVAAKIDARHWRKQSIQYERLWSDERTAHGRTVANHLRAALDSAEADARNLARVRSKQGAISQRIAHDYETRIADARSVADHLRRAAGETAADPRRRGDPPVPAAGAPARGASGPAAQDGFPVPPGEVILRGDPFDINDRLIATEQAIQLQALIDWVQAQGKVDNSGADASIGGAVER